MPSSEEINELQESVDKAVNYLNSASNKRTANNTIRHQYKVLKDIEKKQMMEIKDKGLEFLEILNRSQPTRELSLAKTKIEEVVMWAVKSITQ